MSVTPVMGFHTIKLVVEFEQVSDATGYDPCPDSFLLVATQSRLMFQPRAINKLSKTKMIKMNSDI
jgi:hypothetical protein